MCLLYYLLLLSMISFLTKLFCTILFFKGALVRQDTVIMPRTIQIIGFLLFWNKSIVLLLTISYDIIKQMLGY